MNASFLLVLLLLVLVTAVTVVSVDAAPEVDLSEEEIRKTLDGMSLAMLVNILEEQGVYLGDNYYSKEELIYYIIQLAQSDRPKSKPESGSKSDSEKQTTSNSRTATQNSKSAATGKKPATIWEQFKQQVRNDLAPYLLFVPEPVKKYFAHMLPKFHNTVGQLLRGAMVPMLHVAVQALRRAGQLLVATSSRLEEVLTPPARAMSSWS